MFCALADMEHTQALLPPFSWHEVRLALRPFQDGEHLEEDGPYPAHPSLDSKDQPWELWLEVVGTTRGHCLWSGLMLQPECTHNIMPSHRHLSLDEGIRRQEEMAYMMLTNDQGSEDVPKECPRFIN